MYSRIKRAFLSRGVLHRQRDELLIGRQDGSLRLRLLPLHVSVELSALGPGAELLHRHLFEVEALFQVGAELVDVCGGRHGVGSRLGNVKDVNILKNKK